MNVLLADLYLLAVPGRQYQYHGGKPLRPRFWSVSLIMFLSYLATIRCASAMNRAVRTAVSSVHATHDALTTVPQMAMPSLP